MEDLNHTTPTHIATQSMDDMVFEGKNKSYGAYVLRQNYPRLFLKANLFALSVFVVSVLATYAYEQYWPKSDNSETDAYIPVEFSLIEPPSSAFNANIVVEAKKGQEQNTDDKEMTAVAKDEANKDLNKDKSKDDPKNNKDTASGNNGQGDDENTVHTVVDQAPYFIGGEDAFQEFLISNLQYPDQEMKNRQEGVCTVSFVITKEGMVEQVAVWRASGFQNFDAEALRVIGLCDKRFKPAIKRGKVVKSICRIDITFNLK